MNDIRIAEKVLQRISPEFHHFEVKDNKVVAYKKCNFEPKFMYFSYYDLTKNWKQLVRTVMGEFRQSSYFARECEQWGCD